MARPRAAGRRPAIGTTVKDVARLAGVSPITVSRALSAPERLSAQTLERVRGAIRQTGYVPNLLAGGLRSARSRLVAAVVPTIAGPVFLDTVQALTDALDARGYQLMLGQAGYRDSREDALIEAIIGRRPSGIVLTGMVHSAAARRRLTTSGIPVVETWDLTPRPIDMVVGFSHERIGEAVAGFLHARGRRRPAIISGDDSRALRRIEGFREAARRLGWNAPVVETVPAPTTLAAGRAGLERLWAAHSGVDAIFASSDLLALGVLRGEAHAQEGWTFSLTPYLWLPTPYIYTAWWPWVQNYDGELRAGAVRPGPIYARIWIDREMKKKMGF